MALGDGIFTVTWRIENISLYTEKIDRDLLSPAFKIGRKKPTDFQIYLNSGGWSTKDICVCFLEKPFKVRKDCKLSLLRADGEVIESYKNVITMFQVGTHDLCQQPVLFSSEKAFLLLLRGDTLIIRLEVYDIPHGRCFLRTVFQKNIFRWNIHDFSKSPSFTKSFELSPLCVRLDLSKVQHNIIKAKLIPSNQDILHFGNCAIVAVDQEENKVYRYGRVNVLRCKTFPNIGDAGGDPVLINDYSWEAPVMLNEGVCNLIVNDTLTLEWEFTVGIGKIWDLSVSARMAGLVASSATASAGTVQRPSSSAPKNGSLQSDMLRLYKSMEFCDVTLECPGHSFQVHRGVICARSPVFFSMFASDTEERRTGVVRIPDIQTATMELMLRFLYADCLDGDMVWEAAARLYYAADKYGIRALKDGCVRILEFGLSVDNACDALVLADSHQDEDLMQAVEDFVSRHEAVLVSAQWKELEKKNSSLTTQFFRKMYFKKKKV